MKYKVEAFDKMHFFIRTAIEPMIHCRIDFAGHIDIDVLKKAVTLSMDTVPLIQCCFDDSRLLPRWIDKHFTAEDIVHVENADRDKDTEKQIADRLAKEIDMKTEPQLKIHIIRKTEGDTFCVIINHMISDGGGFKQYLYLLGELYTKLKKNQPIPVIAPQQRGLKPLLSGMKLAEKLRIMRSPAYYLDAFASIEQLGTDFNAINGSAYIARQTISKEQFDKLRSFGKSLDATVNDTFMALFLRSFCKLTKTDKAKCLSTMDMRRFIPPNINIGRGIDNYSSHGACLVYIKADDPFNVTVKQVKEQMDYYKTGNNILRGMIWWHYIARFIPFHTLKRQYAKFINIPALIFSNFSIIDSALSRFDDLPIESYAISAGINHSPCFQLIISTYRGCCTLCSSFFGDDDSKLWVDRLYNNIISEIESLTNHPLAEGLHSKHSDF